MYSTDLTQLNHPARGFRIPTPVVTAEDLSFGRDISFVLFLSFGLPNENILFWSEWATTSAIITGSLNGRGCPETLP